MRATSRFKNIISYEKPVLVDFYADWCQPCKQIQPVLEEIRNNLKDNIRILKVNVDRNPFIVKEYKIKKLPTLILFKSGNIEWCGEGIYDTCELLSIVKNTLTPNVDI